MWSWQPVSFQLVSRSWNKMIFRRISELILAWIEVSNINVEVFVCVDVLRPTQPNGVMSSAVSLPNHTFTGQA